MNISWSATVVTLCLTGSSGAVPAQDADAGEKVFRKCSACHNVGEGAGNSVGPALNGVIGRLAGSYEGYRYSGALQAAGEAGLVWDAETISDYIADPREFMQAYLDDAKARPKMTFKLSDAQDRRDVIAYIEQFSDPADPQDSGSDMDPDAATEQDGAALTPQENKVCVRNASADTHFFAAEGKGVERVTATLAPGQTLCSAARGDGWSGVVSVYESASGFEGCSRLVRTGTVEEMLAYADFDRCAWSSNTRD